MQKDRIAVFDAARGFTMLIMPAVHSVMLYSNTQVQQGIMGKVLAFLAEGPGAQLFLLLMGVSINLSRPGTSQQVLSRALSLFGLAYLLNFLKLVMPISLGIMPVTFLYDAGFSADDTGMLHALFMGDILQTAAIGYLVCGMLARMPKFQAQAIILTITIIACSPLLWQHGPASSLWMLTSLFTGKAPYSFFPVFPWISYPLAGLVTGSYFKSCRNAHRFFLYTLSIGFMMLVAGKIITRFEPAAWNVSFYRTGIGGTLCHLGIVLMWLFLCDLLVTISRHNFFIRFLAWLSRHITLVYFVQWITVLWLLPVYQYHALDIWQSVFALITNSALSFGITFLLIRIWDTLLKQPVCGKSAARKSAAGSK
ncbi:heparan-alpha-glucosaminide N-acetyltransferase domain-containing protein [Parafilimonas sp.]|uniref:heparan-alpha-glucosaminide N-acetyltransferase domain-containing protein n=1 Tax=Parafilimonas sp. TaxID=1969739 RepID=UPI0039E32BAA